MKNAYLRRMSKRFLYSAFILVALSSGGSINASTGTEGLKGVMQSLNVKGQVFDAEGNSVIGASVLEKGTTNGMITDFDGNFSFNVSSPNAVVVISYIGYQTIEMKASQIAANPRIILKEDAEVLDEVVVVGYGAQKKETLTGAVTVVTDKMIQDKGSLSSPLQAMQGQVPGVTITRNSSAPGDESWDLQLRGASSANSAAPLIIIDGIAQEGSGSLSNLNPNDIESINFLKDASAAIYGSRAAGGVVLVTTKQAKEGKTQVEYSGSYTYKMVGLQPQLMSLQEWADALIQARTNDGYPDTDRFLRFARYSKAMEGKYVNLDNSANPLPGFDDVMDFVFLDTNWTDVLFGNAGSTQHDLAISGGNEKNLFRLSLGYLYDDSNLKWGNNNNKRYNVRLTNKIQFTDWFKLESIISYNRKDQVSPSKLDDTLTGSYPQPGLPASTIDGKPYAWGSWVSPVWYAELGGDNSLKVSEVGINEKLNFNLTKELDLVVNLGYTSSVASREIVNKAFDVYNYVGDKLNTTPEVTKQDESSYEKTSTRRDYYSASGYFNYAKSFNDHSLNLMLGTQYELTQYDKFGAKVMNIQNSLEAINGSGLVTLTDDKGTKWEEAILSYFTRINYNYKSKYLAEFNFRYDGSSKFKEGRWSPFYGVSAGWRVSEEDFMSSTRGWLDELKLRLSYGVVGNQSGIDRYEGEQYYNFTSASGAYLGSGLASLINTNGKIASFGREWERIHNYNLGIDFKLFGNRLSATIEGYMKKNNNMLITVTYPGILGDGAGYSNSGKFEAKGVEFQLGWSDRVNDDFGYNFGGTFSYNTNKLVDIGGVTVLESGFVSKQQGYPLNSVFGLRYTGKIQNEEQLKKYLNRFLDGNTVGLTQDIRLGDNMFEDVNKDGKLDQNDYVYLGTDDPKISFSFNMGFNWKGFDLSAIFQGVGMRTIFREDVTWRIPMRTYFNNFSNQSVGNTWSPETPNAYYPTYTNDKNLNNYNYQSSSWMAEDGSYLRLKNIVLGYTFNKDLLKKLKVVSNARVYISGADLWEISHINDGWDPEASRKVEGVGRYPFTRSITAGINFTFK